MRCPVCGVPSPEGSRFCQVCGHHFPEFDVNPPPTQPSGVKTDTLVVAVVLVVVAIVVVGAFAFLFLMQDWESDRAYYTEGVSVEITSAHWETLDSFGLPPDDGCQWLWLDFVLLNEGSDDITVSSFDFKVRCSSGSEYLTIDLSGPDALGPSGLGLFDAVFEIPISVTPTDLVYREFNHVICTATIPTPEPASAYIAIEELIVVSLPFDMDGMIWTILDEKCIWVNFTMENLWWEELDLYDFTFTLEDEASELEYVWQKTGPDALDPGEEGGITLVFIVDLDFEPQELHYKMPFGPSTSAVLSI